MFAVFDRLGCNAGADIGYAGRVDCTFYKVHLRDEVCILAGNVLACFHQAVCLFHGVCNRNIVVCNACVLERMNRVLNVDVGNNRRGDAVHQHHLGDHAAAHLTCADNTSADDFAFLLTLQELFIHV